MARRMLSRASNGHMGLRIYMPNSTRRRKIILTRGRDWPLKRKVWIYPVCGQTYVGDNLPERCSICDVSKDRCVGF
ncbi:MAG: rubredoxin-like domain-containing protein [Thermoproteota archaeon]